MIAFLIGFCCIVAIAIGLFVFVRMSMSNKKGKSNNNRPAPGPVLLVPGTTRPSRQQNNNTFKPPPRSITTYADFRASVSDSTIYGTGASTDLAIVSKALSDTSTFERSKASMRSIMQDALRIRKDQSSNSKELKNHFEAEALRMVDAAAPKCMAQKDDAAFLECSTKVVASMPVLLERAGPADAPVLNEIKDHVDACTSSVQTSGYPNACLDGLFAYAKDLDNYGLPRNLHIYKKTIEFFEGIQREAATYETDNAEELAFKEALRGIDQFGLTPDLKVLTLYKVKAEGHDGTSGYAGSHTMALKHFPKFDSWKSGAKIVYDFGVYNFIHELGHMIAMRAIHALRNAGFYAWFRHGNTGKYCRDEGHSDLWHKATVFASHMAKRYLKKNGVVETDAEYATLVMAVNGYHHNEYHKCFEPHLPTVQDPKTWTFDVDYARRGPS